MGRTFIERWYGENGLALDVVFDSDHARFDVVAGELVVFSHVAFVEVLRWCMRGDSVIYDLSGDNAIDVSPPEGGGGSGPSE